jgi:hypothetical protein
MLYAIDSQTERAYLEYAKAIAYSPRLLDSTFYLQLIKKHEDEMAVVVSRSSAIVNELPGSPARIAALAKLSNSTSGPAGTKVLLADALEMLPNLSYPWEYLGEMTEADGDSNGAALDYKRALFIDPGNPVVLEQLANLDHASGRNREGLRLAQMALMVETPSEHAQRSERLYGMSSLSPDDVVPTGLWDYLQPRLDVDQLCKTVYEISGRDGIVVPANVAEKIRMRGGKC